MFQAIVSAEDVTLGKPNPQVFLKAAGKIGKNLDARNCPAMRVYDTPLNGDLLFIGIESFVMEAEVNSLDNLSRPANHLPAAK